MLYGDIPQGVVLVGATVAVTTAVYAVYRLGARRKWWPLVRFRRGNRGDGGTNTACCGGVHNNEIVRDKGGSERDLNWKGGGSACDGGSDGGSTSVVGGHAEFEGGRPSNGSGCSSPGKDGLARSNSRTEELLAEADALIGADPPPSPPHDRRISNDEIDALVDLTHRVLAREPSAMSEIADDAASVGDLSDVGSPRNSTSKWDAASSSSDGATPRTPPEHIQ